MADMRRQPELHSGTCSSHGGFLLFWCRKCNEWLCSDCTIADHRSATCSVLSMKQAVESFHKEAEEYVRRLDVHFTQSKSLMEKCQAWEDASLQLLENLKSLMKILQERQGSTEILLEEGSERLSLIKSITEAQSGKSLEVNTSDAINLWHKGRKDFGFRVAECLRTDDNVTETISDAVSIVKQLDFTSIQADQQQSPGFDATVLTPEAVTPSSLSTILAKDPNMLARGFLLEVTGGTFSFNDVCLVLGKDNIEHLESNFNGLYIITVKIPEVRDYIVSKIKSFTKQQRNSRLAGVGIYHVHLISSVKVKAKGILKGIPVCIAMHNLSDIQSIISETIPILKNVTLEFEMWPGTNMYNGNLLMTCEVSDLKELDNLIRTRREQQKLSHWDITFGSFIGRFTVEQAGPFQERQILPPAPLREYVTGWSW